MQELNTDVLSQLPKGLIVEAINNHLGSKYRLSVQILMKITGESELAVKEFLNGLTYDLNPKIFHKKIEPIANQYQYR